MNPELIPHLRKIRLHLAQDEVAAEVASPSRTRRSRARTRAHSDRWLVLLRWLAGGTAATACVLVLVVLVAGCGSTFPNNPDPATDAPVSVSNAATDSHTVHFPDQVQVTVTCPSATGVVGAIFGPTTEPGVVVDSDTTWTHAYATGAGIPDQGLLVRVSVLGNTGDPTSGCTSRMTEITPNGAEVRELGSSTGITQTDTVFSATITARPAV